jgi:tRNA modification GTPase
MKQETIAAISTAIGKGGIGIIRVSGDSALEIAKLILDKYPKNRFAEYCPFRNKYGHIIDEGICLFFKSPNSFTGEDVVEFQCHGGPVVLDMLMQEILNTNMVRQAKPGEFSERAFLNGKIDLTQAEAIADLINASSEQAAQSAINSLQGTFSSLINNLNEELIKLRTYVEATIDFPDESIDFINDGQVLIGLNKLISSIQQILNTAKQGLILQEGIKIVIAGRPNAGKSSLLNSLCEKECAIVTEIEGTTRDVLRENINIDGMPIHIIDTAGLRNHTSDIVEKIGIDKAWNEIIHANRILFIYDISKVNSTNTVDPQIELYSTIKSKTENKIPFTIILNKIDLVTEYEIPTIFKEENVIKISAKHNDGIAKLKEHLKKVAGFSNNTEGVFSARRRHVTALEQAINHLTISLEMIKNGNNFEISAEEMREAQQNLNEILGKFSADDLLSEIFNTFCIGK